MPEIDHKCACKDCSNQAKHKCSVCKSVSYCSKECQKAHWPEHKINCQEVKPGNVQSFESLSVKQLKIVLGNKIASFDAKERGKITTKMDNIVEKPSLIKLVQKYVELNDVDKLLVVTKQPTTEPASSSSSSSSSSSCAAKRRKENTIKFDPSHAATPTPEQMRQQAMMMRSNPRLVRESQPAFANYTDAQIKQIADQLDHAAADPNAMKELEKVFKLSGDDRNNLQRIQEGLTGVKPIDGAWIEDVIQTFKAKPQIFKTLLKGAGAQAEASGFSSEQVEGFIDMAARMDLFTLRCIAYAIWYLASAVKPMTEAYKTVDSYTFGAGRYIALALLAFAGYYLSMWMYWLLKLIFTQVYALVLYLAALANGTAGSVASTTLNAASSSSSAAAGGVGVAVGGAGAAVGAGAAAGLAGNAAAAGKMAEGVGAGGKVAQDSEFEF